jgi:hypothetical protein
MARHAQQPKWLDQELNLLLFSAWEHGARHAALQPQDQGTVISYLAADGGEHTERLSLSYDTLVKRLRQMATRLGQVRVDMGGHQWRVEAVVPGSQRPERVFLHMRPYDE